MRETAVNRTTQPLAERHSTVKVVKKVEVNYLLYLPENFTTEKKRWPIMIFLHGAGERGNYLPLVTRHGPPKLIKQGKQFPFILVAPQCPENQWWDVEVLDAWFDELSQKLPIDVSRVYLTGLSMGGFATWAWAARRPDRFAAIVPICGGGIPLDAPKLKNIPIWVFHGAKDPVVDIRRSEEMVAALKKVGAKVKFTVYPEAGHDSWSQTYDNPQLYDWLLKQVK